MKTGLPSPARIFGLTALIASTLLVSGCATYRQHPDFKARQAGIFTAAVIPTEIEVYRLSFKGDKDPMHDTAAEANQVAGNQIAAQLRLKGYNIQPVDFSEEALSRNPDVRATWHTMKNTYAKTLSDIQKRRQKKFTYSFGPDINILADYAKADTLVFLKGEGIKKTGGEITREVILSALFGTPLLPSQTQVMLAVVDGNTGDVLWLNNNTAVNVNPSEAPQVNKMIQKILYPFPKSAALQAKQKEQKNQKKKSSKSSPSSGVNPAMGPPLIPAR